MELDLILKVCWVIIVVVFTLIILFGFISTIVKTIQAPKRKREAEKALNEAIEDFCKMIEQNHKEDKPKKKTTRKSVKKEEK